MEIVKLRLLSDTGVDELNGATEGAVTPAAESDLNGRAKNGVSASAGNTLSSQGHEKGMALGSDFAPSGPPW